MHRLRAHALMLGKRQGLSRRCGGCGVAVEPDRTECGACQRRRMRIARGVDPLDACLEPPLVGGCEICGGGQGAGRDGLMLDHDHETGRLRGWLCNGCNLAVAHLSDPDTLAAAIAYLSREPRPRRSPHPVECAVEAGA